MSMIFVICTNTPVSDWQTKMVIKWIKVDSKSTLILVNRMHCEIMFYSSWSTVMADYRLVPSQWETSLQSNTIWLGTNLELALYSASWELCNEFMLALLWFTKFTIILQGYFTGTGAIIWLLQCQWSNHEECECYNKLWTQWEQYYTWHKINFKMSPYKMALYHYIHTFIEN